MSIWECNDNLNIEKGRNCILEEKKGLIGHESRGVHFQRPRTWLGRIQWSIAASELSLLIDSCTYGVHFMELLQWNGRKRGVIQRYYGSNTEVIDYTSTDDSFEYPALLGTLFNRFLDCVIRWQTTPVSSCFWRSVPNSFTNLSFF